MNAFSKHDLIGKELADDEIMSAWERFKVELTKRKKLKLSIDVPALLLLRCQSLLRMIPDDQFQYEMADIFELLIDQWKQQFAGAVEPSRMAGSLRAMQEKVINRYTGEKQLFRRDTGRMRAAKITIAYYDLLDLEFLCESLTSAYDEEGVIFTVEGILSTLFVDLMSRIQRGDVKNLSKILAAHARAGGEAV